MKIVTLKKNPKNNFLTLDCQTPSSNKKNQNECLKVLKNKYFSHTTRNSSSAHKNLNADTKCQSSIREKWSKNDHCRQRSMDLLNNRIHRRFPKISSFSSLEKHPKTTSQVSPQIFYRK
jgi:hypothetical protein